MKKVMIAAMAAMVLASGASADEKNGDELYTVNTLAFMLDNAEKTQKADIGFGAIAVDGVASAAVDWNIKTDFDLFKTDFTIDLSKDYKGGVFKLGGFGLAYSGFGYLDTTINQKSSSGWFGMVGLNERFDMRKGRIAFDAGYRCGILHGPAASVRYSTKLSDTDNEIGIKLIYEKINDTGTLTGVFTTLSF